MIAQADAVSWTGAWAAMLIVGVVLVGAGLLVVSIARKAADGRLGPNALAGIRTRTTRSSPAAWMAAHQAAERNTVVAGWAMATAGIAAPIVGWLAGQPDDPDRAMLWWAVIVLFGSAVLVGLVIAGAMKGQAAAKAVMEENEPTN